MVKQMDLNCAGAGKIGRFIKCKLSFQPDSIGLACFVQDVPASPKLLKQLLSELGFDECRKWNQVQDHVDEEQSGREDEGDAEVEPPVHEHVQLVTLVAVLLLEVVGAVDVPDSRKQLLKKFPYLTLTLHSPH